MEPDEPGPVRYWLEFDPSAIMPEPPEPGSIQLDGGSPLYLCLHRGIGVTGYDLKDCLALVRAQVGLPLPPVTRIVRMPRIPDEYRGLIGNPAWRGIWFPPANLSGPVIGSVGLSASTTE
jgi:hypothetical protein